MSRHDKFDEFSEMLIYPFTCPRIYVKIILTTSNANNKPPEAAAAGWTLHVRRPNEEDSWKLLLKMMPRLVVESDDV